MPETCTDIAAEAILPGGGCHGLVSLCLSSSFAWRNVCNHSALEDLAELLSTCNLTMAISIDRWRLLWSCFSAQIRGRGDSPLASLCHQMHCIWYMCDISFSNMSNGYHPPTHPNHPPPTHHWHNFGCYPLLLPYTQ